jgi:undecaprenyl diphosphate synthase
MKELLDLQNLPKHIAIIMDGNGRWAKKQGAMRVFGHRSAIKAVRDTTEICAELGIGYLTLYAFSTENWNRPKAEVDALMSLLVKTIAGEVKTLMKNNIRLLTIGNTNDLPTKAQKSLQQAIETTAQNTGMGLVLALSYSGRWDIAEATKRIAEKIQKNELKPEDITTDTITQHLSTSQIPDPELLIRTSGEMRISNFLLWQLAYSELYITQILWPDFRRENLMEAILDYQKRERRFGMISEQLK